MTGSFYDVETAVNPVDDGHWRGHVHPQWNIGGNPNGGYLLSLVLRAMQSLGAHADPITVTTHYLRPGTPAEDCDVHAELIRSGRSLSTARGSMRQAGKQRIEVLAAFGDLTTAGPVDAAITMEPPEMPSPEQCVLRSGADQGVDLPILDRTEIRIHPDHAGGAKVGRAEVAGWIRFADGRAPDAMSAPLFADAFPPSLFGLLGVIGWVPTIELTVHVRRRPAPGWLLGRFQSSDLHNGRVVEDGALWDETGALVAQSRQVGLLLS